MINGLSDFRKEKNKTMQEMASEIGISTSFYIKVEIGERNPSYSFLKKFKSAYPDADIDKIFFENYTHEKCSK